MLSALFNERVTIRRATARSARNKITFTQLVDSTGFPLTVNCRISTKKRRLFTTTGNEKESDAQMAFRSDRDPQLQDEDLIVRTNGETYRIESIDREQQLGTKIEAGRASLRRVTDIVPKDKHDGN